MAIATGTRLGRYKVLSTLGAGGMGEVYLAEDLELERTVALKILQADVAQDQQRMGRFMQEAKAASALNHPNILTIYEIGRADKSAFIATEYIKGATLRTHMAASAHKLAETLGIVIQVASALQAAHEAGIIHRDIKPENIMVRDDGYVKVLDFGLAKLTEKTSGAIDTEAATRALVNTEPGKVMGTVAYMSPEQARGLQVDARTDIWSLGVVIYEMIAGTRPFEGATPTDVILSIIEREPPPLARFSREAPEALEWIVAKALMKDRGERYQTVKELLTDLRRLVKRLEFEAELERSVPPETVSAGLSRSLSGNHPTVLNTGARGARRETEEAKDPPATTDGRATPQTSSVEMVARGIRRHRTGALAIVVITIAVAGSIIVGLAALSFYYGRRSGQSTPTQIDSIAVMPFANVGGDPSTEYLSDGLTESIINNLTQLPNLTVMARSTVFRYKGKEPDLQQVARELKVKAILTGRVTQRGDTLSISAELVDVSNGRLIWGEQYNRRLTDLLGIQEEISRQISEKLRLRLTGEEQKQLARRNTANTEAYQFYLRGRYHWNRRTVADIKKSIEYFEQAIAIDPAYALAYAGLADAYQVLPSYSLKSANEAYPKAKAAALKALEIDSGMAEPHATLGVVKYEHEWNFPGAEQEFRRSIELNPNYASARQWYAEFLSAMARPDESLVQARRALELDPLSLIINSTLGVIYLDAGQVEPAIEQLKKTVEMDPNFSRSHLFLSIAYEDKGMFEESIAEFQKTLSLVATPEVALKSAAALREAYKTGGTKGYWQKKAEIGQELHNQGGDMPTSAVAALYARTGDKERSFEWLEKAFKERDPNILYLRSDRGFNEMRSDPRFIDLVRRIGLT